MDEIIEGTVGSLHILARDYQNRRIIRSHHCIPLIVKVRFLFTVLSFLLLITIVGTSFFARFCHVFYSCS